MSQGISKSARLHVETEISRHRSRQQSPLGNPRFRGERAASSRSRSPSSSLGGRFDPTAYALERAERLRKSRKGPSWGARASDRSHISLLDEMCSIVLFVIRYNHESGYSSATSQVYMSCYIKWK